MQSYNGDAETIYKSFHALNYSENVISKKMGRKYGALLLSEICTSLVNKISNKVEHDNEIVQMSSKEICGLQYLAGYVFHKLYSKLRGNKEWNSSYNQHSINILQAGKSTLNDSQRLVDTLNRGGLWKVNDDVQQIFTYCECIFREYTSKGETKIDEKFLTNIITSNSSIQSYYKNIYINVEPKFPKEIANNLLEHIIGLYLRVRCHSYARDIKEKHNIAKKALRKRSLRTEIKKSSSSMDHGH